VFESRQLKLFLLLFMTSNNSKKYGNRCKQLDGRYGSVRKRKCTVASISSARSSSEHMVGKHLTPTTSDTMG